jgi:hypothetical protein
MRPEDLAASHDLSVRMVADGTIIVDSNESHGFKWTAEGLQNFNVLLWDGTYGTYVPFLSFSIRQEDSCNTMLQQWYSP